MQLTFDGDQHAPVKIDTIQFPGGERHVRFDTNANTKPKRATIRQNIKSSDDLMDLLLLTDAVRRQYPGIRIHLECPYFPYARQDRVAVKGEPLSVAVIAKLINSQRYASVEVWDAHSDVTTALIDNVVHDTCEDRIRGVLSKKNFNTIVLPDAGAEKRLPKLNKPVICCEKKRDVVTGQIAGTVVHGLDNSHGPFLIVDDICDGGRTFIEIAKVIRHYCTQQKMLHPNISLYVTHGIFSKGFDELVYYFDHIYVANLFPPIETCPSNFITLCTR